MTTISRTKEQHEALVYFDEVHAALKRADALITRYQVRTEKIYEADNWQKKIPATAQIEVKIECSSSKYDEIMDLVDNLRRGFYLMTSLPKYSQYTEISEPYFATSSRRHSFVLKMTYVEPTSDLKDFYKDTPHAAESAMGWPSKLGLEITGISEKKDG